MPAEGLNVFAHMKQDPPSHAVEDAVRRVQGDVVIATLVYNEQYKAGWQSPSWRATGTW